MTGFVGVAFSCPRAPESVRRGPYIPFGFCRADLGARGRRSSKHLILRYGGGSGAEIGIS